MKSTLLLIVIGPVISGIGLARQAHESGLISASGWKQTLLFIGLSYVTALIIGGVWR